MTQIVSAESKAAFKSFVSKLNQIEASAPDKSYNNDVTIITEGQDTSNFQVPDFIATKKERVAVNVDKSMVGILENLDKVMSSKKETVNLYEQEERPLIRNKSSETRPITEMTMWEIEKNTDGKYITYNIKDGVDGRYILENVNLHKIAVKIVKLLENGHYINDRDITRLLRLDEDFSFYYTESVEAKEKYSKTKKDLHEHRFHYAKGQVDLLEKQIVRECL